MRFDDDFIEQVRSSIQISDVIGTRVSWDRKKTRAAKGDWWACCPFHGENSPSFHCDDRRGRYKCFGCGASGDHFRFFVELDGMSFPRAVEAVADLAGVRMPEQAPETPQERARRQERAKQRAAQEDARKRQQEAETERKVETVRSIWSEAIPIKGTLAERYLVGRGVAPMDWPPSLRFHAGLKHTSGLILPALICGVQNAARALVALWRIFLDRDGSKAKVENPKLGLGPAGGGAVRLGPLAPEICVCEGVETGFGVGCLTKWSKPVWPLLSTSGMTGWEPPQGIRKVQIYADGDRHKVRDGKVSDPPGRVAAHALKARLAGRGIEAVIHEPPAGSDWLDIWVGLQAEEGRQRDVVYTS